MKRLIAAPILLAIAALAPLVQAGAQAAPASGARAPGGVLVTSDWLARHLSDPDLVLLYVGSDSVYGLSHISGSQFVRTRPFAAPMDTAAMAAMHDPPAAPSRMRSRSSCPRRPASTARWPRSA